MTRLAVALLVLFLAAIPLTVRSGDFAVPSTPTNQIVGCPQAGWPSQSLVHCFFQSALTFRNHATKWRHTQCPGQPDTYAFWGHCACAVSASVAIMNATLKNLAYLNVDRFKALAEGGRLGGLYPVNDDKARAGDIILWYSADFTEAHVGFCATDRCTRTWSNSSSKGVFAPIAHSITLDGFYPRHYIWEPRHIP